MARRRWELDRANRARLANLTPEQQPNGIWLRLVAISNERVVTETVFRTWETRRETRRKLREFMAFVHAH